METALRILIDALYLLTLINPMSKIAVLASFSTAAKRKEFSSVVTRTSAVAALLLLGVMISGNFVLRQVFHVDLFSLRVAGGGVLVWVGLSALRKGVFFEQETHGSFADLAVVPLACPMIAGPATIAASITLASRQGIAGPACSVLLAVAVNFILMRFTRQIAGILNRFHILNILIRITGLIVMTMGVQMVFDGVAEWVAGLPR
jgi:multiple antibiotic resistance protein